MDRQVGGVVAELFFTIRSPLKRAAGRFFYVQALPARLLRWPLHSLCFQLTR